MYSFKTLKKLCLIAAYFCVPSVGMAQNDHQLLVFI